MLRKALTILLTLLLGTCIYFASYGFYNRILLDYLAYKKVETVVVVHGASWCPPCRQIKPMMNALHDAKFIHLINSDVDKKDERSWGVVAPSIPMISIYRLVDGNMYLLYYGNIPQVEAAFLVMLFSGSKVKPNDIYPIMEKTSPWRKH